MPQHVPSSWCLDIVSNVFEIASTSNLKPFQLQFYKYINKFQQHVQPVFQTPIDTNQHNSRNVSIRFKHTLNHVSNNSKHLHKSSQTLSRTMLTSWHNVYTQTATQALSLNFKLVVAMLREKSERKNHHHRRRHHHQRGLLDLVLARLRAFPAVPLLTVAAHTCCVAISIRWKQARMWRNLAFETHQSR